MERWQGIHVNSSEYGPPESWVEWPTMQRWKIKPHVVVRSCSQSSGDRERMCES